MMMKKSWSRKAVSPVIATILMVAITVVLAAVLYVMVMGFGGNNTPTAPAVTLTKESALGREVVSINPATNTSQFVLYAAGSSSNVMSAFVDAGSDGKVTTGDYFNLASLTAGTTYNFVWISGGTNTVLGSFVA